MCSSTEQRRRRLPEIFEFVQYVPRFHSMVGRFMLPLCFWRHTLYYFFENALGCLWGRGDGGEGIHATTGGGFSVPEFCVDVDKQRLSARFSSFPFCKALLVWLTFFRVPYSFGSIMIIFCSRYFADCLPCAWS